MPRYISVARIARSIDREQRAQQKAQQRELQRRAKLAKQMHAEQRQEMVDQLNHELDDQLNTLKSILPAGIRRSFKFTDIVPALEHAGIIVSDPGKPPTPPNENQFSLPRPDFLEQLFGFGKEKRLQKARSIEEAHQTALQQHALATKVFTTKLQKYEAGIKKFQEAIMNGDSEEILKYSTSILQSSAYPDEFPQTARLSFNATTGELVIEYDLPAYDDIMPTLKGYKYIKTRDEVQEIAFNKTDQKGLRVLYEDVVAAIALRTLHEVFSAEGLEKVKSIAFNGMVSGVDKATGKDVRPCIITLHTSREEFSQLDLNRVDRVACLKYLKAQTSPSSEELIPVKPVVELVMTDPRFVDEVDILSGVDSRTNLLDMDPFEFEHLISNLFTQIGLKTSTTRASRDGGVDVVAFDERPIFGGKVIIQAKRYRNTVEVSAVRDLYGSMMNEGANKGILVTTSQYGSESRKFAKDKPIELIDGNGLLYLLQQHGYNVKIEIPK